MRDELAKAIADTKRRDSAIEQLTRALEERDRIITEMMMENDSLKRYLKIYENPHAPSSHCSVPAQQRKARSAKGAGPSCSMDATKGGRSGRIRRMIRRPCLWWGPRLWGAWKIHGIHHNARPVTISLHAILLDLACSMQKNDLILRRLDLTALLQANLGAP